MTSHDDFYRAVLEAPEDDVPRLVFADWLDEHGETDRADFIRVQIELQQLDETAPRHRELKKRERSLIRKYKHDWLGKLPTGLQFNGFRRGFPTVRTFALAQNYLKKAKRWHELAPLSHHLHVQIGAAEPDLLASVMATSLLTRVVDLNFYGSNVGDAGAELIGACRSLRHLPRLCLAGNRLGPAGVGHLIAKTYLNELVELELSFNPWIGDEGAVALAQATTLSRLRVLNLFSAGIGDEGGRALAEATGLAGLRKLVLTMNAIGPDVRRLLVDRFGTGVFLHSQSR
ncbi:MAG: TIGR02996 domain-containing protein [Gemmataceae bacterium]